jgi:hypothetical protein
MAKIDITSLFVYRIIHIDNLEYILKHGLYVRDHKKFDPDYINIGNSEIIDVRKSSPVRIKGYGFIGDYVPFYFGRQSIMLYNILTGYAGLQRCSPDKIIYLCTKIPDLINSCPKFFFTDGQANQHITEHFNNINNLNEVDWEVVNGSDFKKTPEDFDKPRRYQAEFLVHQHVPIDCITRIITYDNTTMNSIKSLLLEVGLKITVEVSPKNCYYFYF